MSIDPRTATASATLCPPIGAERQTTRDVVKKHVEFEQGQPLDRMLEDMGWPSSRVARLLWLRGRAVAHEVFRTDEGTIQDRRQRFAEMLCRLLEHVDARGDDS